MGKFIKLLDENYEFWQDGECPVESKLEYLSHAIFDFNTYDSEIDVLFAKKMIPVLKCILDKTTYEYQEDREQYINYLLMVNMPFLVDKLEYGSSIRGAWFDEWDEYEIDCGRIKIENHEINEFIADLIEWSDMF
jgi:hypothetical protein